MADGYATVEPCHEITLTIDGGGVDVDWTCSAPVGAECRLTCPEGCEEWDQFHEHELVDDGACVALVWLDNGAWDERYTGPPQQLRCAPVYLLWNGYGYDWSYDPLPATAPSDASTP